MTDIDAIRERHRRSAWERYRDDDGRPLPKPEFVQGDVCVCGDYWGDNGCDTAVVLAALAKAPRGYHNGYDDGFAARTAELRECRARADKAEAALADESMERADAERQADAAREDAERLYKALRTRQCLCTATHPGTCLRCAALAAHDALVGPYDTVRMTEEPTP
jgi:hypothetical protein